MRGRTLNDSFIILDEAQNTSMEQMKMFLTRLGFGSKVVVTGDITQIDLPGGTRSGLRVVQGILDNVEDIAFCHLTNHDVVRHKLVGTDRRGVRPVRGDPARAGASSEQMTVDINNESGLEADSAGLARLATFAMDQLRIHPQAELSILLVDEQTMSAYHEKYMDEPAQQTCCRSRWMSCARRMTTRSRLRASSVTSCSALR